MLVGEHLCVGAVVGLETRKNQAFIDFAHYGQQRNKAEVFRGAPHFGFPATFEQEEGVPRRPFRRERAFLECGGVQLAEKRRKYSIAAMVNDGGYAIRARGAPESSRANGGAEVSGSDRWHSGVVSGRVHRNNRGEITGSAGGFKGVSDRGQELQWGERGKRIIQGGESR